jgi:hypothetical protein
MHKHIFIPLSLSLFRPFFFLFFLLLFLILLRAGGPQNFLLPAVDFYRSRNV